MTAENELPDEGEPENTKDSSGGQSAFRAVGVVFFVVGLTMGIAQQNWAMALPFVVLGVTFLILGCQERGRDDG